MRHKNYEVEDGKLTLKNKASPKTDSFSLMAEHKDRRTCGRTGYTEFKKSE